MRRNNNEPVEMTHVVALREKEDLVVRAVYGMFQVSHVVSTIFICIYEWVYGVPFMTSIFLIFCSCA
jgi:hypothetical protein